MDTWSDIRALLEGQDDDLEHQELGVWGATTEAERRAMREARQPSEAA